MSGSLKRNLEAAVGFMADLQKNNHKQWFDANRERYIAVLRDPMKTLAAELSLPMTSLLADFSGKPKISRINNDLRFHPNKPVYKEHMWVSFASGSVADPFAALGQDGWSTGMMLGSWESERMKIWRQNLIQRPELWRAWCEAVDFKKNVTIWIGGSYKRPLFPDIPENVLDMVQAKQMVIHTKTKKRFPAEPVGWLADGIAMHLPLYLMATVPTAGLNKRLDDLGNGIPPLGERSDRVFRAFAAL